MKNGCEKCKQGAYSFLNPYPERIAVYEDGPTFLHLCSLCGTYWEFTISLARIIDKKEAIEKYLSAFKK